jgi:hypothetical protein
MTSDMLVPLRASGISAGPLPCRAITGWNVLRPSADENFNGDIVRGLLRRNPTLDIVRVQDVGLSGADDPSVLQWAADQGRVIVTHVSTLAKHSFDRIAAGQPMPGVFEVRSVAPVGQAIDDLILLAECSFDGGCEGQVHFLPL